MEKQNIVSLIFNSLFHGFGMSLGWSLGRFIAPLVLMFLGGFVIYLLMNPATMNEFMNLVREFVK